MTPAANSELLADNDIMQFYVNELDRPDVIRLLQEHLDSMVDISPPGSVHALDLDALRHPDIIFWTVREESVLLGCGALKKIDEEHGEIKSMRTASAHLGKGVASALLQEIIKESIKQGFRRLSLETGSTDRFAAAKSLYAKFGFRECEPFANYSNDWHSLFMTKELSAD